MSIFKVTHGFVSQEFDDDGDCVGQSFHCGDDCQWEDENNPIDEPANAKYETYDMRQPVRIPFRFKSDGHKVTVVFSTRAGCLQFCDLLRQDSACEGGE